MTSAARDKSDARPRLSAADHHARIAQALKFGEFATVQALLSTARAVYPQHTGLALQEARLYCAQGEVDRAAQLLTSLPDTQLFGEALVPAVEMLHRAGGADALRHILSGIPDELRNTRQARLAELRHAELGEGLSAALHLAQELRCTAPEDPVWMMEETRLLQKAGQFDQVIEVLEDWRATPLDAASVMRLCNAYLATGRPDAAHKLLAGRRDLTGTNPGLAAVEIRALVADAMAEEALPLARTATARWPDHPDLHAGLWQALAGSRQLAEAVEACTAFAKRLTGQAAAVTKAARFLASHAELTRAIALVDESVARPQLTELRAELALQAQDPDEAAALLYAHHEKTRPSDTSLHLLARVENARGFARKAYDVLVTRLSQPPRAPASFALEAAAIAGRHGWFDEAAALLDPLDGLRPEQAARRAMIRAKMALEQGDDTAALTEAQHACDCAPKLAEAWSFLSQLQLLSGLVENAVHTQGQSLTERRARQAPQERAPKMMNTIQGQIINEFRLLAQVPDLALMTAERDQMSSAQRLRERLEKQPNSTPLAMGLLNALRREGRIGTHAPKRFRAGAAPRIPAQVFQFWDTTETPEQIARIQQANAQMNPDWRFRRFDAATALTYLRERGEDRAVRAFRSAPHAAAKADIFRLAVLWHEGGVYMDADDRCLEPLDLLVDRHLRHIFYLEPPRTVGNNFLAAEPQSPILRAALEDAVGAFTGPTGEAIWLATGPGAVTRALARVGTDENGALQEGIWVMPMSRLRQSVAMHLRLTYKSSPAHWLRQLSRADGD